MLFKVDTICHSGKIVKAVQRITLNGYYNIYSLILSKQKTDIQLHDTMFYAIMHYKSSQTYDKIK